ncbi:ArsR/SmtB family transcription factor [Corynebacterium atrinae]|uniref:ArsR/SmtB family transcription factor n=1 Tax=Corynebacterium atrinae TaxID=1336740 RepID=UPI0025B2B35D|nr:metalloregulator ArsR/SmtB family transcription factor [Corynebacterium atrinae]
MTTAAHAQDSLELALDRCCAPGGNPPVTREDAEVISRLFKAIADPIRLQILGLVRSSPDQEICACELPEPLGITQPTVSHHLKILVEADLLARERRGQWAWFRLVPETLSIARRALEF